MSTPQPAPAASLPLAERLSAARWSALWLEGDPSALAPPLVALIGTREPDLLGSGLARTLAADLAKEGVGVLSGGALGIDAAAHRGALDAGGRTVVVLPSGFDHPYPLRHRGLYEAIVREGGAVVSQFPPETPPTRWTFPKRNELLAAMADVVVVVQAPLASGSLITAEAAMRLGRRVMAVPASPGDRRGSGCLRLLRAGALPCMSAADVLTCLERTEGPLVASERVRGTKGPAAGERPQPRRRRPERDGAVGAIPTPEADLTGSLDDDGRLVYHSLGSAPRHVDELLRLTGLPAPRLQRSLLTLVLCGLCEDRGGGTFALTRR